MIESSVKLILLVTQAGRFHTLENSFACVTDERVSLLDVVLCGAVWCGCGVVWCRWHRKYEVVARAWDVAASLPRGHQRWWRRCRWCGDGVGGGDGIRGGEKSYEGGGECSGGSGKGTV